MSKLRAVELAVDFLRGRDGYAPTAIIETARAIAEFIGEDAPAKPVSAGRKAKAAETPPVITVDAEQAANEIAVDAPPVVETPKTQTPPPASQAAQTTATAVSEADVKALVGKLATNAAAGGAPKAREILGLYGATNISTLKPEKYALVKASIEALLKAAEEAAAIAA